MTENVIKIVVISLVCLPIVLLVIALQWHTWRTKDNDLFHEEEFWISSKSRRAIQAIVILFAIVMRRDNEITASEALVAHEYFDKKFKSSRYMTVFRTDGNVLRSVLKKYLKGKLPTFRDCTSNILKAGVSYEVRLELLDYLFKTAYVSEGICDAEMVKLREIAQFLLIKEGTSSPWSINTSSGGGNLAIGKRRTNASTNYPKASCDRRTSPWVWRWTLRMKR